MFKTRFIVPNWSKRTLFKLCSKGHAPFDTNILLLLALLACPGPPQIHDKLILIPLHTHLVFYANVNPIFSTYQIHFLICDNSPHLPSKQRCGVGDYEFWRSPYALSLGVHLIDLCDVTTLILVFHCMKWSEIDFKDGEAKSLMGLKIGR